MNAAAGSGMPAGDPGFVLGFAGMVISGASARDTWEETSARCAAPEISTMLATLAATDQGRAALGSARQRWLDHGFVPPWEPAITPVPLAAAVPGELGVPAGTTASRCAACGETRLSFPGDLTDEWKHHFDYCTYPEVATSRPEGEWSPAEAGAAVAAALEQLDRETGPWHPSDSFLDRIREADE